MAVFERPQQLVKAGLERVPVEHRARAKRSAPGAAKTVAPLLAMALVLALMAALGLGQWPVALLTLAACLWAVVIVCQAIRGRERAVTLAACRDYESKRQQAGNAKLVKASRYWLVEIAALVVGGFMTGAAVSSAHAAGLLPWLACLALAGYGVWQWLDRRHDPYRFFDSIHEQLVSDPHAFAESGTSKGTRQEAWRLSGARTKEATPSGETGVEPAEDLDELLAELQAMTGLEAVKRQVRELVTFTQVQLRRDKPKQLVEHLIFDGPPGTGKTTVAQLVGRIYRAMGLLGTERPFVFKQVGAEDFKKGWVGQSEEKTNALIDAALGGVLFLDEAYALAGDQFAESVIPILLTRMENERGQFVVIAAGYPHEMRRWLKQNSGLASRFNRTITFEPYSAEELLDITCGMAAEDGYHFDAEARELLLRELSALLADYGDGDWANGREARKLYETVLKTHSVRNRDEHDIEKLNTLLAGDVVAAVADFRSQRDNGIVKNEPSPFDDLLSSFGASQ
jgi:SpoVK/Ycf46/Vps4 family AAA+-type ATPase